MKGNSPTIEAMPGFILMSPYDGIKMLSEIFGHYELEQFRASLWDFYKASLIHQARFDAPAVRNDFTNMFTIMNDLATAGYLLCRQQGLVDADELPEAPFFPAWQRFESNPRTVIINTFKSCSLDMFRSRLWVMFTFAVQYTRNDNEQEMDELIFLFERLNDLITACYAITTTPQLSTIIQNS